MDWSLLTKLAWQQAAIFAQLISGDFLWKCMLKPAQTQLTTTCAANRFLDWKEMCLYYMWKIKRGEKGGKLRFLERRTTMRALHEVPSQCWDCHILIFNTFLLSSHIQWPISSTKTLHFQIPQSRGNTRVSSILYCFLHCFTCSSLEQADQKSCTARGVAAGPPLLQLSKCHLMFKCLTLDPICKALAFLLSCVCIDWSHLHMQIKSQYETLNIPSTSFSAAETWVNISLHPFLWGEGFSWVSKC